VTDLERERCTSGDKRGMRGSDVSSATSVVWTIFQAV